MDQEISSLYKNFTLDAFESADPIQSHATDYVQFIDAPEDGDYEIVNYEFGYEAYFIVRKDVNVWCDDSFVVSPLWQGEAISHTAF